MRRLAVLCVAGAVAACGGQPVPAPVAFCQAQAESTPEVKDLTLKSVSNPYFISQNTDLIAATKAQAVRDCLKRQGVLASGGGVEAAPQSSGTIFSK